LKKELNNQEVELFEMGKNEPVIQDFDVTVVGFPIMMGKAAKIARKYIKAHYDELKSNKTAYYMCCGFIDCFDEYEKMCIPFELRDAAVDVTCLGGSLDPNRFKGINKLIVKSVRSEILGGGDNGDERKDMSLPTILEENISQLADKIKKSAMP
jgi:menaquinone-dependent protoporphyrinogen IX oxidase